MPTSSQPTKTAPAVAVTPFAPPVAATPFASPGAAACASSRAAARGGGAPESNGAGLAATARLDAAVAELLRYERALADKLGAPSQLASGSAPAVKPAGGLALDRAGGLALERAGGLARGLGKSCRDRARELTDIGVWRRQREAGAEGVVARVDRNVSTALAALRARRGTGAVAPRVAGLVSVEAGGSRSLYLRPAPDGNTGAAAFPKRLPDVPGSQLRPGIPTSEPRPRVPGSKWARRVSG
jgi:hypothetical protein